MSHSRFVRAAVVGALAAAALGAVPEAASAAVPGIVRVSAVSASNSLDKSSTAGCPAGKQVIGVGAELNGAGGQVVIDEIVPNAALTAATTFAYEDASGFAGNWTITTYVVCANPLAGLTMASATSASNSVNKSVTVSCPAGRYVVGAAFRVTGGVGDVVPTNVNPNIGLQSVTTTAYEGGAGTAANWSVTAIALCANLLTGLTRVDAYSLVNSSLYKSATAACPPGTVMTGGGFLVGGVGQVIPDDFRPSSPPATQLFGAYEDDTGYAGSTYAQSIGICATA